MFDAETLVAFNLGDVRFAVPYERLRRAEDRPALLREMEDDDVVRALAHASREPDPYLANILASEAMNRMRRARTVLRHLGEGVLALDAHGRITEMNPAAERMLGVPRGSLLGADEHATFHAHASDDDEAREGEGCAIRSVLRDLDFIEIEEETFMRGDATRFVASYCAASIVREGRVEGAVVAFHDVTERLAREGDLRAWHALVSTFYHVHDRLGIGLVLVEGERLAFANEAFRAMVGRSLDELREQNDLIENVHPDDRARVEETFTAIFSGGEPNLEQSARLIRSDGRWVEASVLVSQVHPIDHVPRLVCVVRLKDAP